MANDALSPHLLDESLIKYTTDVTRNAWQDPDAIVKKRRAELALQFFLDILDPAIDEERRQLDIFRSYHAALNDFELARSLLEKLPPVASEAAAHPSDNFGNDHTTATHQVLTLPDTLDHIFSFLAIRTKSDRAALCKASLASHAFYDAAKHQLWKRPRTLDTIRKQVLFAFGAYISGAFGASLGHCVQRLNVRIFKGCWNMKLLLKIGSLTPNLTSLTIYWGDTMDGEEAVTNESVASICQILSTLSKLDFLYLSKFSYTPPTEGSVIPIDAHIPFTRLKSLHLYRFHWLWDAIYQGLGANLESLDIGFGTIVESRQIIDLAAKLPNLKSFSAGGLKPEDFVTTLKRIPALEHIFINNFSEFDDTYSAQLIRQLITMKNLKTIHMNNCVIGGAELEQLTASPLSLEYIWLELRREDSIPQNIIKFLKAKQKRLKKISIFFRYEDRYHLQASDDIVNALAGIANLERIDIDFARPDVYTKLSAASVNALLINCPKLRLTKGLRILAAGNELFQEEYMAKMTKTQKEEEKTYSVDE